MSGCRSTRELTEDEWRDYVAAPLERARAWANRTRQAARALAFRAGRAGEGRSDAIDRDGPSRLFAGHLWRLFRVDAAARQYQYVTRVTYIADRVAVVLGAFRKQHFEHCEPVDSEPNAMTFPALELATTIFLCPRFFDDAWMSMGNTRDPVDARAWDLIHETVHLAAHLHDPRETYSLDRARCGSGSDGLRPSFALANADTYACLIYSVGRGEPVRTARPALAPPVL